MISIILCTCIAAGMHALPYNAEVQKEGPVRQDQAGSWVTAGTRSLPWLTMRAVACDFKDAEKRVCRKDHSHFAGCSQSCFSFSQWQRLNVQNLMLCYSQHGAAPAFAQHHKDVKWTL